MKKTETITTVIDDFTGEKMSNSGWTLTRRKDGKSIDFGSINTLERELQRGHDGGPSFVTKWFGSLQS